MSAPRLWTGMSGGNAWCTCLLVVAFVFASLSAWATGTPFDLSRAARCLRRNVSTVLGQMDIGRELDEVPVPSFWDGSLWTLTHELWCYVLTGLMLCWGVARRDVTRTTVRDLNA